MVAPMIVMIDKCFDLDFEVAGQEVMFQQDAVLEGLVPALDFALGLRVVWRAARVFHAFVLQPSANRFLPASMKSFDHL